MTRRKVDKALEEVNKASTAGGEAPVLSALFVILVASILAFIIL